jgi:hypothetical protein
MLQFGIGKGEVAAVIHQMIGHKLTQEQLTTLMQDDAISPMAIETEHLIAQVAEDDGTCQVFLVDNERAAVLTITHVWSENFRRFGDILFLNGPMIGNSLGWTTLLITLVNKSKQITSGGLLFTAFEDQDVFDWLVEILADILVETLRTMVTNEDSGLVASAYRLTGIRPEIVHRLCTIHKHRNFQKKAVAASWDLTIQAEALSLFQRVIYSKRRSSVDQALRQLKTFLPTLVEYIKVKIEALLPKLTDAFRGAAFTLGSSTNAVSENCNRMLEYGPLLPTFSGIRNAHTCNHTIKAIATQTRTTSRFRTLHFLKRRFDLELSPVVLKLIDIAVENAAHRTITTLLGDPDYWEAHSKHSMWRLHDERTNIPECECNQANGTGIQDCYMIDLFRECG